MTLELFLQILVAAAAIIGGYWALAKLLVAQFNRGLDQRFAALDAARKEGQRQWDERVRRNETKVEEMERDLRKILIELPREYVNRSDYVRRETVIEAKIDQLSLRIQNWILEGKNG